MKRPVRGAALYALLGAAWILFSDRLLFSLVEDAGRQVEWQTAKGWLFVAASGLFVYLIAQLSAKREADALSRERELRVITDSLPGPVSRVDNEGRYIFANAAYTDWFGLAPSELIGKTPRDVLGPALYETFEHHYRAALAGERRQFVIRIRTPGNEPRIGLATLLPDRDEDGIVRGHFTVVLDITDRELERYARAQSETRYARLVEHAPEAIAILRDDRIELINGVAVDLIGAHSQDDAIGYDWREFVPARFHRALEGHLVQALSGEKTESIELIIRRMNGELMPVEASASSFLDDEGIALHLIVRDIRSRKAAEDALMRLNAELEERVARRTGELELALERAESADKLKSLFLATMLHELRTPLNSIIGFTDVLLGETPGPVNAEQREQLTIVQGASRHLLALINDILDISRIEADELELEAALFDLPALVRETVEMLRPNAEAKGLAIRLGIDERLGTHYGDRRRLRQILTNLIENGVKFTETGEIRVGAKLGAEKACGDEIIYLSVEDTGPGIDPDFLDDLFRPFSQASRNSEAGAEGTGLGLAISERLARLMGGGITVSSQSGHGSVFTVTLPHRTSGDVGSTPRAGQRGVGSGGPVIQGSHTQEVGAVVSTPRRRATG